MEHIKELMGKAMALHIDFQLWYLALEEHCKRGIEGIVKDMVWSIKPRWIPRWLWQRWIKKGAKDA